MDNKVFVIHILVVFWIIYLYLWLHLTHPVWLTLNFTSPIDGLLALSLLITQLYWTDLLQDDPFGLISKLDQIKWRCRLGYICVRKTISIMMNYKEQSWSYLTSRGVHQSFYSNPPNGSKLVLGPMDTLTHTHTHTHSHTHTRQDSPNV